MGASNKTKQNSVSQYAPTPEAGSMYSNVFNQATAAQSPYDPQTAKTIADFTAMQQQAFGNIQANQGAWQPQTDAAGNMISNAGAGVTAEDISKFFNPYQQDVIDTTTADINKQNALQTRGYTAQEASQGGLGGSGYFLGKAQMASDQGQNMNRTLADLRSSGWDKSLAAAQGDKTRGLAAGQSLASLAQMISQLKSSDVSQLLAGGNQQQAQQQAVNDAASTNATNKQLYPMQQAQWLASIASGIGPLMGGTTNSSGTATQSQGKGIGNIIGGGLTLASMASDERVKEDVQEVGRTHDGQPIYSFRYAGDPRTQMGLMAQDVERGEHPEAVSEGPGGVKMVNYDRALTDARPGAADGGLQTSMPAGLMPWADLKPAQVRWPEAPDVRPPAQQQDGSQDWEQMAALGKKAGAGLGNIGRMLDPAGGWGAEIVPTASLGAAGGGGALSGLSSLAGLFGFADGGLVPTEEELRAIEMQESGGREDVVSSAGAEGPMQIMPETGRDPGFGVRPFDYSITEPKAKAAENRRFGRDYYTAMLQRYNGDRDAARIAYNGGPARADAWLKAGRDDSVIPAESANYYKQVAGRIGQGGDVVVAKATSPEASKAAGGGEPYRNNADRAAGGFIKRAFGVEFNPLGLTENERRAMLVAGLSMLSSGDVGKGGLAGMQYLTGIESGEREAATERSKLAYQMKKDAADLALRTRGADLEEKKYKTGETRAEEELRLKKEAADLEAKKFTSTDKREDAKLGLDLDKFNQETSNEAAKLRWEREKQQLDAGKPSEDMREYAAYTEQEKAAGREPKSFFQYQVDLKAAGRPSTNVTVSGDKKGAEEMAKLHAKSYDTLRTNAAGADTLIDSLDNVEKAINTGIQTGMGGEAVQYARKIGAAIGIADIDKVAAGEVIQQVSNRLALAVRSPGGEAGGMPGAMSDADRQFLKETVPGLLKTPEGNKRIIKIMRVAAERHRTIFEMAVDYAQEHDGQLDAGFDRVVRDYVKANPLSKAVEDQPRLVPTTKVPGAPSGFKVLEVHP